MVLEQSAEEFSARESLSRCETTQIIGKVLSDLPERRAIHLGGELDLDFRFAFDMSQKLERQSRASEKTNTLADCFFTRRNGAWCHEMLLQPPNQAAAVNRSVSRRDGQETNPDIQFRTTVEFPVTSEDKGHARFIPEPVRDLCEYIQAAGGPGMLPREIGLG